MLLGVIASQLPVISATGPVSQSLTAALFVDDDTFFAPTVTGGASSQFLTASLVADADTFFAPTVAPGAVTLTPALVTDTDTFFAPVVVNASDTDDTLGLFVMQG